MDIKFSKIGVGGLTIITGEVDDRRASVGYIIKGINSTEEEYLMLQIKKVVEHSLNAPQA